AAQGRYRHDSPKNAPPQLVQVHARILAQNQSRNSDDVRRRHAGSIEELVIRVGAGGGGKNIHAGGAEMHGRLTEVGKIGQQVVPINRGDGNDVVELIIGGISGKEVVV